MEQTTTSPKAQHISFHCPSWLVAAIDRSIAKTVIENSTQDKLFAFNRTTFILDAIIKHNNFVDPATIESALEAVTA